MYMNSIRRIGNSDTEDTKVHRGPSCKDIFSEQKGGGSKRIFM